jgi:hypothetical protein
MGSSHHVTNVPTVLVGWEIGKHNPGWIITVIPTVFFMESFTTFGTKYSIICPTLCFLSLRCGKSRLIDKKSKVIITLSQMEL